MIVEIEYYQGDVLLYGKHISLGEFIGQMKSIEADYDRQEDNFIALLCRRYHWEICTEDLRPQYVYDRDIEKAYLVKA